MANKDDDVKQILASLREEAKKVILEGKKIISHFSKMEKDYSDWEDRLNALDKKIYEMEDDYGLIPEEVFKEPDAIDDIFGDGFLDS